jgi:hypothetical protein
VVFCPGGAGEWRLDFRTGGSTAGAENNRRASGPSGKVAVYVLQYELTGDEGVKSKALEITWRLLSPLDETDPAKTSFLASQRHSYLRINSDVHNVRL